VPPLAPVVIPPAFQNHGDLKPAQVQFAVEIGNKFPGIVQAAIDFEQAYSEVLSVSAKAGGKYFTLCSELRIAKMNRRESSLLLRGLGFTKNRVHEILKVSEVDDSIWNQYTAGQVGFKAVFALAGDSKDGATVSDTETQVPGWESTAGGIEKTPRARNLIKDCPESIRTRLNAVANGWQVKETPVEFAYAVVRNGKRFYFAISVSDVPTKETTTETSE